MKLNDSPRLSPLARVVAMTLLTLAIWLQGGPVWAAVTGTTWYVDRYGDGAADGDVVTRSGTLRFTLAHATGGDTVSFAHNDAAVDIIYAAEPLVVPPGVAVGYSHGSACRNYTASLLNVQAYSTAVNPVFSLGAGATLAGVSIGGGYTSVKVTGDDVDICGVGIGIGRDGDGVVTSLPPISLGLSIDGARTTVRRSFIGAAMAVSSRSSDTRIGDAIGGSGDANDGVRQAAITVLADAGGAAQRVTLRDPFPRGLNGMAGSGVFGGDDTVNHANNWAQTPTVQTAYTFDNFASVSVTGTANPLSLVDLYYDTQISITHGAPVQADASGVFTATAALPGPAVKVSAVSTLEDPAHPGRVGSSSQLSASVEVVAADTATLRMDAVGRVSDLSGPANGPARPGETVRFSVTMTNPGSVAVTGIHTLALALPAGLTIAPGSGAMRGAAAAGFTPSDAGFSRGVLAAGQSATYSLDLVVSATPPLGTALFGADIAADGVASSFVGGSIQIAPAVRLRWLPLGYG